MKQIEDFGERTVLHEDRKVVAQGPFYHCDPEKNKLCRRTICYTRLGRDPGFGECHLTKNANFALDDDKQPYYILHLRNAEELRFVEIPRDQLFKEGVLS